MSNELDQEQGMLKTACNFRQLHNGRNVSSKTTSLEVGVLHFLDSRLRGNDNKTINVR